MMYESARINVSISASTSTSYPLNKKFKDRRLHYRLEIGIPKDKADSIIYNSPYETYTVKQLIANLRAERGIDVLRPIFDHQNEIRRYIQTGVYKNMHVGDGGVRHLLSEYGKKWVRNLRDYILGGQALSHIKDSTLDRRKYKKKEYPSYYTYPEGMDKPLVETGTLLNSFGYEVTSLDENILSREWTSGKVGRPKNKTASSVAAQRRMKKQSPKRGDIEVSVKRVSDPIRQDNIYKSVTREILASNPRYGRDYSVTKQSLIKPFLRRLMEGVRDNTDPDTKKAYTQILYDFGYDV